MKIIIYLIPISIFLGGIGLAAFLWSFRSGQYQDMDGAAERVLFDEDDAPDTGRHGDNQPAPPGRAL